MSEQQDPYYQAYLREKKARREVEQLLEDSSRLLYEKNQILEQQLTQIKLQQNTLLQHEKLSTLGTLAAGLAHEINNPLAFVISNLKTLEYYTGQLLTQAHDSIDPTMLEDIPDLLSEMEQGALRIKSIVKNLLFFSQNETNNTQVIELQQAIELALIMLKAELNQIDVQTAIASEHRILFTPSEFSVLLVNLLLNAKQACAKLSRSALITLQSQIVQDKLHLTIRDNGCGMDDTTQQKIFQPFFTTLPVGQGTGMGLPMVLKLLQKHQGEILVNSAPDQGTCITLILSIAS